MVAYGKAVLINKYYSMIIYVVHLQDAITCPIGLIICLGITEE